MSQNKRDVRLDPRAEVRVKVVVFGASPERRNVAMVTRDLSAGGALCESDAAVPPGRPFKMQLDLASESGALHPVVLEAIVLRVEGSGPFAVAFHFVDVPERIRDLIRRFVVRHLQSPSA